MRTKTVKWVIVDLDGTLFNDSARAHFAEAKQWESYHNRLKFDTIHEKVMEIVQYWAKGGYGLLFCTGRPEKWRQESKDKLAKEVGFDYELLMRKDDDYRPAVLVKEELIKEFFSVDFRAGDQISAIIDDRKDILRRLGATLIEYFPPEIGVKLYHIKDGKPDTVWTPPLAGQEASRKPVEAQQAEEAGEDRATVPAMLENLAGLYRARNAEYGDNYRQIGPIYTTLESMVTDGGGFSARTAHDWQKLSLLVFIITKLSRVAAGWNRGGFIDSLDDIAVYAMLLRELCEMEEGNGEK